MSDFPPDTHRLSPDAHPTPYSAEQIRAASSEGTVITYRMETLDGDPYLDRWEFLGGDGDRARRRRWTESIDGEVLEEPTEVESSWLDLQRHASFPAATTRLMTGSAITPAGEFDCWVYVTANDDGSITTASFARSEPGPPVLMESRREGEVLFRMVLVEAIRPG